MENRSQAPIGIFDSGIGGLTVAHAIKQVLPKERLIYFGDTAHLPYGDKSAAAVQAYAVKIADLLVANGCKVIVIACNTASAVANELLIEYVASRSKVINVVDPMVELVRGVANGGRVGVIGTKGTIASGIYKSKLEAANSTLLVTELATPLLVPMIEEGFIKNKVSAEIINNYLSDSTLHDISHLVLGCTHYPLIKGQIAKYYDNKVQIHDSSIVIAEYLKNYLTEQGLLKEQNGGALDHFYVSDYTEDFEHSAKHFFGDVITLEEYKLWE